jgi:hypothetical protein
MRYYIEDKHSGKGVNFDGDFDAACRNACDMCNTDSSVFCVWEQPSNIKIAECTLRGTRWIHRGIRELGTAMNWPPPDTPTGAYPQAD